MRGVFVMKRLRSFVTTIIAILLIASNSSTAFAAIQLTRPEDEYTDRRNNCDYDNDDDHQIDKKQVIQLRYDDEYVYWDKIESSTKYELKFYYKNGGYIDTKTTTSNKYSMSKIKSLIKSDGGRYGNVEVYFNIRPVYSDGVGGTYTSSKTLSFWIEKKNSSSSSNSTVGGPAYSTNSGYSWSGGTGNWYLSYNGKSATGWHYVNGYWYYMYSSGKMATGWISDGGYTYYLNPSTNASIPEGAMVTGYWSVDGTSHYFNPNSGGPQGSMVW